MRYILLAYADEQQLGAMSSSEREALGNACLTNDEALRKSGHLLAVEGLQSSRSATGCGFYVIFFFPIRKRSKSTHSS